jgi:hypothetical protein
MMMMMMVKKMMMMAEQRFIRTIERLRRYYLGPIQKPGNSNAGHTNCLGWTPVGADGDESRSLRAKHNGAVVVEGHLPGALVGSGAGAPPRCSCFNVVCTAGRHSRTIQPP